jgi:hypothetical protein
MIILPTRIGTQMYEAPQPGGGGVGKKQFDRKDSASILFVEQVILLLICHF